MCYNTLSPIPLYFRFASVISLRSDNKNLVYVMYIRNVNVIRYIYIYIICNVMESLVCSQIIKKNLKSAVIRNGEVKQILVYD